MKINSRRIQGMLIMTTYMVFFKTINLTLAITCYIALVFHIMDVFMHIANNERERSDEKILNLPGSIAGLIFQIGSIGLVYLVTYQLLHKHAVQEFFRIPILNQ